jgi:hypothetical protein
MKILNLYACLGGNRYKWDEVANIEVTAVELDTELARMYQERFPDDTVIIAMNTSMIMDLAEKHGLKVRNRKRELVYKRYYLWSELRRWHSLSAIGEMFNMDHCSVLHGLKQHNVWMKAKDYEYLKDYQ